MNKTDIIDFFLSYFFARESYLEQLYQMRPHGHLVSDTLTVILRELITILITLTIAVDWLC